MDLVILLVLIGLVLFFFRRFSSFIYFIGFIDILLRIITFVKEELLSGEIYAFVNKYIPASIPAIIDNYSSGLLYTILLWLYVAAMAIFEFYVIKSFFRRK